MHGYTVAQAIRAQYTALAHSQKNITKHALQQYIELFELTADSIEILKKNTKQTANSTRTYCPSNFAIEKLIFQIPLRTPNKNKNNGVHYLRDQQGSCKIFGCFCM